MTFLNDLVENWMTIYWILFSLILFAIVFKLKDFILIKGFRLTRSGKYYEAIDYFKSRLNEQSNRAVYWYGIAYAYFMLDYRQHASEAYNIILDLNYREVEACFYLALLSGSKKRFEQSWKWIEKGIEKNTKRTFFLKWRKFQTREIMGWISFLMCDYSSARYHYDYAIPRWSKLFRKNPLLERFCSIYYRIAKIYQHEGDQKNAEIFFNRCITSSPMSAYADKANEELKKYISGTNMNTNSTDKNIEI